MINIKNIFFTASIFYFNIDWSKYLTQIILINTQYPNILSSLHDLLPPSSPPPHICREMGLRLPLAPQLLQHHVPPSPCCLPGSRTQMPQPGSEACSLNFHEHHREMTPVLAQNQASPPLRHRLARFTREVEHP